MPKVTPALLNSVDFTLYAGLTGMMYPFPLVNDVGDSLRKPASYEVSIGGSWLTWRPGDDEHRQTGRRSEGIVCPGKGPVHSRHATSRLVCESDVLIPRNSLIFVELASRFYLPSYIAARYNLAISHVYKGLLVGTGPLVDPGFTGKIFLPIHNLTNHDYRLDAKEGAVWVEFTKLSESSQSLQRAESAEVEDLVQSVRTRLENSSERALEDDLAFPQKKQDLSLHNYLAKATPHLSVESSMGELVLKAEAAEAHADGVRATFDAFRMQMTRIGLIGALAVLIALATLVATFVSVVNDMVARVSVDVETSESNDDVFREEEEAEEEEEATSGRTIQPTGVVYNRSEVESEARH